WFRNHYRCARCAKQWTDEWSATCDDDCPHCGARHMSPFKSEHIPGPCPARRERNADRIRELNDAFRSTFSGGTILTTAGVAELPTIVRTNVLLKVAAFDEFTGDHDPHKEQDYGAFEVAGERFFWKIDYYDTDMVGGSEDPAD